MVHESFHQQVPGYISSMCHPVSDNAYLARHRSAKRGDLISPRWNTATYGQRGFDYSGPTVWNALPVSIRKKHSLYSFRKDLKTHLFRKAYDVNAF